jgi:hypothetical protein
VILSIGKSTRLGSTAGACPPPQLTKGSGELVERRELPQRGLGQSPSRKRTLVNFTVSFGALQHTSQRFQEM